MDSGGGECGERFGVDVLGVGDSEERRPGWFKNRRVDEYSQRFEEAIIPTTELLYSQMENE